MRKYSDPVLAKKSTISRFVNIALCSIIFVLSVKASVNTGLSDLYGSSADSLDIRMSHLDPGNTPLNNQIWSIQESRSGWVFFAEEEGILALRGSEWQLIETPNATTVRSLNIQQVSGKETLFYGEQGDFGYVEIDSTGLFSAISLSSLLPDSIAFGNVWNVHSREDAVFFQSREFVFRLSQGKVELWNSEAGFHNSFMSNGRYFVREFGIGLKEYFGQGLDLVLGGEQFSDAIISGITSNDHHQVIVWSQKRGQYFEEVENSGFTKRLEYSVELNEIASSFRLYSVEKLGNSRFVIATLGAGLLIVDDTGTILKVLKTESGFPDDSQNYLLHSQNGGLWVGLDNEGAAYLDSDLVRLNYSGNHGISGYIHDLKSIGGRLYVASGAGLFVSSETASVFSPDDFLYSNDSSSDDFVQVGELSLIWSLAEFNQKLILATEAGVFFGTTIEHDFSDNFCKVLDEQGQQLPTQAYVFHLTLDQKHLIVGLENGVGEVIFRHDNSCFVRRINVGSENYEIRSIAESAGRLWFGTAFHGFISFDTSQIDSRTPEIIVSSSHFPGRNDVISWGRKIVGVNSEGLVILSADTRRNVKIASLNIRGETELKNISLVSGMRAGTSWLVTRDSLVQLTEFGGEIIISRIPESLKFPKSSTSSILVDSTGVVWFNNGSELIRYDPKYDTGEKKHFDAHIAQVSQNSNGKVLFYGVFRADNGGIATVQPEWSIPQLNYEDRTLSFAFSATEFTNPDAVEYRYMIEGDKNSVWSEWRDEPEVVVSYLNEGSYTLKAQAKDEIGRISKAAAYSFVILPPWYRTYGAYLVYIMVGFALIISTRKYVLMRRANKLAEEQAVELAREREVVKKLSEANDRLKQANKLKDEFLATTSHELRTPLTAILGFTSVLKEEIPEDAEYREFLDIIEDSGERLMETLNSLLDLAKLRAGIMDINMESFDLYQKSIQEIVQFQDAASRKNLHLNIVRPPSSLFAFADIHGLSRVLHSLVGNAIKFTDEGGVTIEFHQSEDCVEVHIIDTGIGIEAEFLPDLFNAFIQESDGLSRTHEGTGLGLAITSGLIELMDATIRVVSDKGQGSTFIVSLGRGEAPRVTPIRVRGMGSGAHA